MLGFNLHTRCVSPRPCSYGKMGLVAGTLMESMDVLGLVLFFMVMLIILFSTLMYFIERGEWDDELAYYVRPLEAKVRTYKCMCVAWHVQMFRISLIILFYVATCCACHSQWRAQTSHARARPHA